MLYIKSLFKIEAYFKLESLNKLLLKAFLF
jgi:hypothetical protein